MDFKTGHYAGGYQNGASAPNLFKLTHYPEIGTEQEHARCSWLAMGTLPGPSLLVFHLNEERPNDEDRFQRLARSTLRPTPKVSMSRSGGTATIGAVGGTIQSASVQAALPSVRDSAVAQ